MALIKCPECGKEISDKASACINCGFPLAAMQTESVEEKNKKEVIYYDLLEARLKMVFNNGIEDGAEGICNDNSNEYKYRVRNGCIYSDIRPGVVSKMVIDGDFLAADCGKHNGYIPEGSKFNAICSKKNLMGGIDRVIFKDDGTYRETSSLLGDSSGRYMRKGKILVQCGSNTGNSPNGFLIHNGEYYIASKIKEEKVKELKELFSQVENSKAPLYSSPIYKPATPLVKSYNEIKEPSKWYEWWQPLLFLSGFTVICKGGGPFVSALMWIAYLAYGYYVTEQERSPKWEFEDMVGKATIFIFVFIILGFILII